MCSFKVLIFTLCSVLVGLTDCTSSFDQRQTGDLNVQIGLKNINIFALLNRGKEEYVDYDYAYDYSEMTIKPPNGTTPKPLNSTSTTIITETHQTVNTSSPVSLDQTTESMIKSSTTNYLEDTEVTLKQTTNNFVYTTTKSSADVPTTISLDSSNNTNATAPPGNNKCRRGFVQNAEGKCEYKVHGTTNALRRIVKLAQKIKIGRDYEAGHEGP